jgi:hypothetical protein
MSWQEQYIILVAFLELVGSRALDNGSGAVQRSSRAESFSG